MRHGEDSSSKTNSSENTFLKKNRKKSRHPLDPFPGPWPRGCVLSPAGTLNRLCVCMCECVYVCVNGQSQEGFCHSVISYSATSLNIAGRQLLAQGKSSVFKAQTAVCLSTLKKTSYFRNAPFFFKSPTYFLKVTVLVNISFCMFFSPPLRFSIPKLLFVLLCPSLLPSLPTSIGSPGLCRTSPAEGLESIPLPPLSSWFI